MSPFERNRLLLIALPLLACWPVWQWMAQRATDGASDPWELLGLATALWFVRQRGSIRGREGVKLALPIGLVVVYAVSFHVLPPMLRAVIAVSALAAVISAACFGRRMHFALWGLLLLSLPIIPSLNFYLGYPLRVLTGSAGAALLQMNGFAVAREGAMLVWNGSTIAVDAPCSGIKMLWTGCYLSCTLAAFQGLGAGRTALLGLLGFVVVVIANILRASALFLVEADIVALPKEWHELVGVAIFALTAIGIMGLAQELGRHRHAA